MSMGGVVRKPHLTAVGLSIMCTTNADIRSHELQHRDFMICVPITEQEAQPGDLVFFEHTYDFYERITHIGIYIGNGQMMHFGNPGKISPISSYGNKFVGYGRLPAAIEQENL